MTVRDELYLSLIRELLGPRSSVDEIIRDDPREEYITGVLEPVGVERRNLLDYGIADIDGLISEEEGEEDSDEATDYFQTNPVTTTLHPLARPKSMGISFIVSSLNDPSVDFCVTWARYKKHSGGWIREPRYYISNSINLNKKLDPIKPKVDPAVLIYIRTVPRGENKWHVSLYLVNNTEVDKNAGTTHMIFQPQIRVNVINGTKLERMEYEKIEGEDEQQLSMLYKDLSAYARGHLCGAVWNQIDPAKPLTDSEVHSKLVSADILNIPEPDRSKFMIPDVRTEFLPSYSIDQSTIGLNDLGNLVQDDFNTAVISERWNSEELTEPFRQLVKLYEEWISSKEDILEKKNLPESQLKLLQNNMIKCHQSLERIKQGILLLETDENVKLAFLFMNKVIDTQYQWYKSGSNLIWRPFQISFILQCIQGVADPSSPDRDICDLLWYPTGGGKTEAYMGLIIFCLALRRLRIGNDFDSGAGTGVISRYTLRLLTIQQFRRALKAIVAADYLRVVEWSPKQMPSKVSSLWGEQRFSIGLWVGESVTPNNLVTRNGWDNMRKARIRYPGAIDILMNRHRESPVQGEIISRDTMGEPAQVIKCPCCSTILAIPAAGVVGSQHELYWIIKSDSKPKIVAQDLAFHPFTVSDVQIMPHVANKEFYVLYVRFSTSEEMITDDKIREWWKKSVQHKAIGRLASCTASRPGYFIRYSRSAHHNPIDFEIHCPNPSCTLATTQWYEKVPSNDNNTYLSPIDTFRSKENDDHWYGVPISAFTVDAQIYAKCPSVIISTVDKFARLPFEPRSATIFGNVSIYDDAWGYGRNEALPDTGGARSGNIIEINKFRPPDLLIQDELHLIEGPLGSMVGLYECAVDILSKINSNSGITKAKYIASTATTRQAATQVNCLFDRTLAQFPPYGLSARDNFFSRYNEGHPLNSNKPGRLYVGVCCPGRGPQTPVVRIWSSLFQETERLRINSGGVITEELDYFWTLVGYFNAVRELAQASKLYREDILQRMREPSRNSYVRNIEDRLPLELSSNKDSSEIPSILEQLEYRGGQTDAVFATSMFGTGVDIERLSLMVVHGQPKTTSSYIQATGRVGRSKGALVVTFLRSTRPRDLDHYEFFTGYHRALYRYVEPVTVFPFSPRAFERALGPVAVSVLRNGTHVSGVPVPPDWAPEEYSTSTRRTSGSRRMSSHRQDPEISALVRSFEQRAQQQTRERRPLKDSITTYLESEFEDWENLSNGHNNLLYTESTYSHQARHPVVLGDPQHDISVFETAPQSMRDVESTTRFKGR